MTATKHTIFRAAAVQSYIEGREKAVLPRFIAPPTFLLLWVMLGLLLMAGAVIVLATRAELRPGQSRILTNGASGLHVTTRVVAVGRAVSSPAALQKRYALGPNGAQVITQPAAVALARRASPQDGAPAAAYVGSIYHTEIRVGARRVITLLFEGDSR